ncbi:MAG: PD-(D/E)XK nuclease family protein [Desulfobacterales bacterium]|nr:PD-(D/E)XK nuclease family protein [Desulfobacterales bacterium]
MTDYPQIPHSKIWEKIEQGAAVVTVNRRLARHLTGEYAARNMAAGRSAWETPDIFPYSAWLENLYDALLINPALASAEKWPDRLSPTQELWIWESVIRDSDYGRGLLQAQAAAKTAQQAWRLCRQWRIDIRQLSHAPPPDTEAFIDWLQNFTRWCRRENWVAASGLPDLVASAIRQSLIEPPETILFAGFDEYPPQMTDLFAAIQSVQKTVKLIAAPSVSSHGERVELPDTETEITHAACWIRHLLTERPDQRIGVIVPDLEAVRQPIIRIFDDILHPDLVFSTDTDLERIYNISLGRPLADYPMVGLALAMLERGGGCIPLSILTGIMRSPFIGGADAELASRSLFDARLRKTGETEFSVDAIYKKAEATGCHHLGRLLRALEAAAGGLSRPRLPSQWTTVFTSLLAALEWPGGRTLSSTAYQTLDAWQEAISRLAEMDRVLGQIPHARAVRLLRQILADTLFQPETGDRPVQVMGVLEAAGAAFDALWVMGVHNEAWPPPPRPNPFIPIWIQRKYHMRHASAEREYEYAKQITGRLTSTAPRVIFSSPRRQGDAELFSSPLIRHLPLSDLDAGKIDPPQFWSDFRNAAAFERTADKTGPEVADGAFVSGGTGLLKAQAECPFKAFVKYRLRTEALEAPVSGLSAAERGALVHRALEKLWETLQTHDALMRMPETDLLAVIEKTVTSAIREKSGLKPQTFTRRFTALETDRLIALITEWLEKERERAPFAVQHREAELPVMICGFGLKTYADRIDQLADGRLVIIDYKTSTPTLNDWFTRRMAEPQLPLYASSLNEPLAAVLFGQVRKGEARFIGVADAEGIAPGVCAIEKDNRQAPEYASLRELLPQWRARLEDLGNEVKSGYAAVSPTAIYQSCRYCDFAPICRINERDMLESENETGG